MTCDRNGGTRTAASEEANNGNDLRLSHASDFGETRHPVQVDSCTHWICLNAGRESQLLRDTLITLSLPADEQILVTKPGCVSCEIEDFRYANECSSQSCLGELTDDASRLLKQIGATIESFTEAECKCFDRTTMEERPKWTKLRELAGQSINAKGWRQFILKQYSQNWTWHLATQQLGYHSCS